MECVLYHHMQIVASFAVATMRLYHVLTLNHCVWWDNKTMVPHVCLLHDYGHMARIKKISRPFRSYVDTYQYNTAFY